MNMRLFRIGLMLAAALPALVPAALACHDELYVEVQTAVGTVIVCV